MAVLKKKTSLHLFLIVFAVNFLLFAAKLYVGLSSNSISIYSDGINNLFDSLSGLLSAVCLYAVGKSKGFAHICKKEKAEQFLSFVLSAVIVGAGFLFLYNSAERLMYPTPVWFTTIYFFVLSATAAVKLLLFFILRKKRKTLSVLAKVIATDSLMDFFITIGTVLAMLLSQVGTFAADAVFGIAVSVVMLVSGGRMCVQCVRKLLNFADAKTEEKIEEILHLYGFDDGNSQLEYTVGEARRAYLKSSLCLSQDAFLQLQKQILEQTGVQIYFIQ